MSLMTPSNLVVFYGLPLGAPGDSENKAWFNDFTTALEKAETDEQNPVDYRDGPVCCFSFGDEPNKGKAGLFELSDAEVENTLVMGVVLAVIDLNDNCHHLEMEKVPAVTADTQARLDRAYQKLPKALLKVVKKHGKGHPRVVAVLTSESY
jgi:hypothetical protein